ncbi:S8 family peptidase [Promethearchaeum syntrophicum]|uniref:S8 family peptidase n=1 Tax=Promethearchaeum syntrophicum TaxID=2594042 RepID=A0A5B9D8Y0_9ARCH|nr:S8 family peptidase [Candidatus Prometheoarchaeum syntrophicum]QEE15200.1 Tk-subtilisin precursor [Candidatus Prometheoarchaeum syntrophicum]
MKKINKILLASMILFSFTFLAFEVKAVEKEPVMYSIMGNGGGGGTLPPEQPPQVIPWGITRVNAITAAAMVDESSTIIAILDTGMDLDHPDLAAQYIWGYDIVNQDTLPDDDHGHGSHCAGTAAGIDNDIGVVGVAPDVGLYILKVLNRRGSGTDLQVATGIIMATEGPDGTPGTSDDADIISMSLSGGYAEIIEDAVAYAISYGVVVVAATGNQYADVPAYPAAYPGVIKVGATDINDVEADFSNDGETILAPGVSIFSTYKNAGYATMSGTSMATPHVAGVCALAIAAHPSYSVVQIVALVEGSADVAGVVDALAVV